MYKCNYNNSYNLSVGNYVQKQDTKKKVDIKSLNNEIKQIVERENILRLEIDKIIAEIDGI